jgi:hypothetical protein
MAKTQATGSRMGRCRARRVAGRLGNRQDFPAIVGANDSEKICVGSTE